MRLALILDVGGTKAASWMCMAAITIAHETAAEACQQSAYTVLATKKRINGRIRGRARLGRMLASLHDAG